MAKYIIGSVVVVLLAIIAVLLVRYEMDKTREVVDRSIKEAASTAARQGINDALGGTPQAGIEVAETIAEGVGRVAGKFRDSLKTPPEDSKPPAAGTKNEGGDKPTPAPSSSDKIPTPLGGLPVPKVPSNPNDLIGGLFGAAREAARTIDDAGQELITMDSAQEKKVGRDVHQAILKDKKIYDNPREQARVKRLAAPLLDLRSRKDIDYTFTLIDEPEVNAFSHLGGYVYVYRGLLDFCGDDDMLQYVLGHELAHVDLKHCVRGMNYAAKADEVTGGLGGQPVMMAYKLIALGYSEDQEFASDDWAYKSMRKLGKSHEQTLLFSRRFLDYLKSEGKPAGKKKQPASLPGSVMQEIDNHFQSHPSAEERLERLEKLKS